jgi:hypothetical protein
VSRGPHTACSPQLIFNPAAIRSVTEHLNLLARNYDRVRSSSGRLTPLAYPERLSRAQMLRQRLCSIAARLALVVWLATFRFLPSHVPGTTASPVIGLLRPLNKRLESHLSRPTLNGSHLVITGPPTAKTASGTLRLLKRSKGRTATLKLTRARRRGTNSQRYQGPP